METLRAEGFVRRGEKDGQYYLTFAVRSLSEGLVDDAWVEQVALPLMRAAVPELLWPCDLGTVEGGFMVVRESTHRFSRLSQHRGMIGENCCCSSRRWDAPIWRLAPKTRRKAAFVARSA